MPEALLFVETSQWTAAAVILDSMEKAAGVRLLQTELNDRRGVCLKASGALGAVEAAARTASATAAAMRTTIVLDVIAAPAAGARAGYEAVPDFNGLLEQPSVRVPREENETLSRYALGFIETQGFTAAFDALDAALKAASVEYVAREKLGGGYIAIVIRGDVAAVEAAIAVAREKVGALGTLIAAHVIPSPSPGVLSLLPPA